MATGGGRESGAGFAEAVLAAPMGGGNGGSGKPLRPMPALPTSLSRRSTDPTGEEGVSPGERDLLLADSPAATLPDGALAVDLAVSEATASVEGGSLDQCQEVVALIGGFRRKLLAVSTGAFEIRKLRDLALEREVISDKIEALLVTTDASSALGSMREALQVELSQLTGLLDALLDVETVKLAHGAVNPVLAYFTFDLGRRVESCLQVDHEGGEMFNREARLRYLHSQQLALQLSEIVFELMGEDEVSSLADVGAYNGDAAARIRWEIQGHGRTLDVDCFDINAERPSLIGRFARSANQPKCDPVEVRRADLMRFSEDAPRLYKNVLLSNIMHKADPRDHEEALLQAAQQVDTSDGPGYIIINTPFWDKDSEDLAVFYKHCDTTSNPEALKPWDYWVTIGTSLGLKVRKERRLGFRASLLDGFQHGVVVWEVPKGWQRPQTAPTSP